MKIADKYIPFLIFAGALLLFIPFLGSVHLFDWDEINFAECAREMVVTGNYSTVQIDYLPFWEKPPLFIWMQAACMNIFGVNEFAARLPNAVGGALTLALLFVTGSRISGRKFAWKWVLLYAGSLLPHFYFRSGIIDPWFNLFIFLSVYQFTIYTGLYIPKTRVDFFSARIVYSALFLSLAVLTKGPAALLIFGLCFLAFRLLHRKPIMAWKHFGLFSLAAALPASLWFIALIVQGKGIVILEFIEYQIRLFSTEDAGHGHNFFYHWYVLVIGCFPASLFALHAFFKNGTMTPFEQHSTRWMRILFWVVLILFSIVKTKIIHYSSLCYFPLTFLAAQAIMQLETGSFQPKKWIGYLGIGIGIIISCVLFILPYFDHIVPWMAGRGWIKDPFAEASFRAGGHWMGWEWIIGLLLLVVTVIGFLYYFSRKIRMAHLVLSFGVLFTISLMSYIVMPNVEMYTQKAAVDFWVSKSNEKAFVETLGYKSYAHYFYANTQPDTLSNQQFEMWLHTRDEIKTNTIVPAERLREYRREWKLVGPIDRPAYFVSKNTYESEVKNYWPFLMKIGEKNGFVFWERKP